MIVLRQRQHLNQITDLQVHPQDFRAHHQMNRPIGKLPYQPFNERHSGVRSLAHPKDDFEFGIVLNAVAAQVFIGLRVRSAYWLENRNRQSGILGGRRSLLLKRLGSPEANNIIADAAERSQSGDDGQQSRHSYWNARANWPVLRNNSSWAFWRL